MTTATTDATVARATAARAAVFAVFTLAGVCFAGVFSRVPDIRDIFGLSPAQLGITLLALSAGSVCGLPSAGPLAARLGQATTVRIGITLASIGLLVVAAATHAVAPRPVLMVGLFLAGTGIGIWDVAMNIEGAAVERALGQNIMPHFHAAFSGGTVGAALIGALLASVGFPVPFHLVGVVLIAFGGGMYATRFFLPVKAAQASETEDEQPKAAGGRSPWTEPRTLLIGVLVLCSAFTEGTANDWLAVALVDGYGLSNGAGVFGLATFLAFMTVGRLLGTRWLDRYGRIAVLRVLFTIAAIGAALVVFGGPVLAFAGVALWGLGASLGFPVGMSAAADDQDRAAMRISTVATIGYLAFIAGPPLLGFLGEHFGVLKSLTVVGALALLALIVLPAAREPERQASRASH